MLTLILKSDYNREGKTQFISIPNASSFNENNKHSEQLFEILSTISKKFMELQRQSNVIIKFDSVITIKNSVTNEITQLPIQINNLIETKNQERKVNPTSYITITKKAKHRLGPITVLIKITSIGIHDSNNSFKVH